MLSIPELIKKKRDGQALNDDDIRDFITGVTSANIQDSQIGAMLMAIWQKGMVTSETKALTREMMQSGEVMSWPEEWAGLVVDKHSTGGVGDKVSLVLAPALAACGCKVHAIHNTQCGLTKHSEHTVNILFVSLRLCVCVRACMRLCVHVFMCVCVRACEVPMISGRGLAHTGGTLDKLESIPGFNVYLTGTQVMETLSSVGCCIVGQTESLVPADRILYALRDATSTVDSLPLITGSIISKKGAESLNALILDVKFGSAALYKNLSSARELAHSLMTAGNGLGMCTGAVLTRMDAPIGRCVGNSLEVMESLEALKGRGPPDLMELVTTQGGMLLMMSGKVSSQSEGTKLISEAVTGGAALSKFQAMMEAQGVANEVAQSLCSTNTDYHRILRKAKHQMELKTQTEGTVRDISGMVLAEVLHKLGAGRTKAGEPVNHSVGAELLVSLGQKVKKGVPWLCVHYEHPALSSDQINQLQNALTVGPHNDTHSHTLVAEQLLPQ